MYISYIIVLSLVYYRFVMCLRPSFLNYNCNIFAIILIKMFLQCSILQHYKYYLQHSERFLKFSN